MRIYDLHDSLDKFIQREDVQVEIIGENPVWTARVSRRKWSNGLQRYEYEELGAITAPDFLSTYDFIAETISRLE